jgi:hypothetical protein
VEAVRFDRLAKTLDAALTRRRALGGLLGLGLTGAHGVERTTAKPKPKHCKNAKSGGHCTSYLICGDRQATCDIRAGTGCSCVLTVEGCLACIDENECGPLCTSSAECEAIDDFGPGSVCEQQPGGSCCPETTGVPGSRCLRPCPA